MDRKKFLKKGTLGLAAIIATPAVISACKKDKTDPNACTPSPSETAGPFPIKTPSELVNSNIIGDRTGIPLQVDILIQNTNSDCSALPNAFVDIWQCDAHGNYSEYSGQQEGDFTSQHFLRGRQTTDVNGKVSFISIYPGWYPGRAPHIHVEVKKQDGTSLLISQIAFPEDISNTVYGTTNYKGDFDTKNKKDGEFKDSISSNMATVSGDNVSGYTLTKTIKVSA